jgi:hypothetical protein
MKDKSGSIVKVLPVERIDEMYGTGLAGYIDCSYKSLVSLLGKPNGQSDGYKTDAEWVVEMNGKVLTIYNYKDGKNYNGRNGLAISKITDWHIGTKENVDAEIKELQKILDPTKTCRTHSLK